VSDEFRNQTVAFQAATQGLERARVRRRLGRCDQNGDLSLGYLVTKRVEVCVLVTF
jgi:hypothetical protein